MEEQRLIQPGLSQLEKTDIEILYLQSNDASQETEEVAKATGLAPHVVRRRIQFLEEEGFIIGYRAMVAYSKFHLASTILFNCNAPTRAIETCKQKLLSLPFPGTFIPVQNGFLCQATLPSEGLAPVHRFLSKYCNNVEVSWYDLVTSDVASLNSKAYNDGVWRTDSSFMIDEPLRTIGRKLTIPRVQSEV
jgi:DNA-binding Lrp family transcriptional regulator